MIEHYIPTIVIIQIHLQDLSKLILYGNEETQKICLNTICLLFTKNTIDSHNIMHIKYLFYLLSVSIQRKHLEVSILENCSKLLDYKGMHALIKSLIYLANQHKYYGHLAIFRIICFPNYYKNIALYSLDSSRSTYFSLKYDIFHYFKDAFAVNISQQALDGFVVFLAEEIAHKCNQYIESGLNLLLSECNHMQIDIAIAAIKAIYVLIPIVPEYHNKIIEFIIRDVISPSKFDKPSLMINILDLALCSLMNLNFNINEETIKILFQRVAKFSADRNIDRKLRIHMDIFLSYLGFYYLNIPLKGTTIEVIDSNLEESSVNPSGENFSLNGNTIITLYEDKFMIRNEFGKYL